MATTKKKKTTTKKTAPKVNMTDEELVKAAKAAKRAHDRATAKLDDIKAVLRERGAGFKLDGVQVIEAAKMVVDEELERGLAALGKLSAAQKVSIDGGKVKALAKIDPRIEALIRFAPSVAVRIDV